MKYLIIHEIRDPFEDNAKKMYAIERERAEKGEGFAEEEKITPIYFPINLPPKGYRIVDCEPEKVMKWVKAYRGILNAEIISVGTREEWAKV